jgi:hypothetical protein
MSEDESDHAPSSDSDDEDDQAQGEDDHRHISQSAPRGRQFKIINMRWRSPEVTKWLRTMDLIYIGTKFYEDGTSVPGNQPRERYPSDKVEIGRPITGLPRNFYDARWLRTLSPHQLEELDIQPEVDINFTVNERKYVPVSATLISQKVTFHHLQRYAAKHIAKKGTLQKNRVSSAAEAESSEVLQWVLTGTGFWEGTRGT